MVQTLATVLMTHKQQPTLKDCLIVLKSLHQKFKKLGDESSEVYYLKRLCFVWFELFNITGSLEVVYIYSLPKCQPKHP